MSEFFGIVDCDGECLLDFFDQLIEIILCDQQGVFIVGFCGYDKGEVDVVFFVLCNQFKQVVVDVVEVQVCEEDVVEVVWVEECVVREVFEVEFVVVNVKVLDVEQQVVIFIFEFVDVLQVDGEEVFLCQQFEVILCVVEEQVNVFIQNVVVQVDWLMIFVCEEVMVQCVEVQVDVEWIIVQVECDVDQVCLKMDIEYIVYEVCIEWEVVYVVEKVNQVVQEVMVIWIEVEKGVVVLCFFVICEMMQLCVDVECEVCEMNVCVLEFEEIFIWCQDDVQQEFFVLYNQVVVYVECIINDVNEQVVVFFEYVQCILVRVEDYEWFICLQVQVIEVDVQVCVCEILECVCVKVQKIVDLVMGYMMVVLCDVEDCMWQLCWQQQQLMSFMVEVCEFICFDGIFFDDIVLVEIIVVDDVDSVLVFVVFLDEVFVVFEESFFGDEVFEDEFDDGLLEKIMIDVVEIKKKFFKQLYDVFLLWFCV